MNVKPLILATAVVAAVLLIAGPSPAQKFNTFQGSLTCGYNIPGCASYTLEDRSVRVTNDCTRPLALEVTVVDGRGSGYMRFSTGESSSLSIGPPIDSEPGKLARYDSISCCSDYANSYVCYSLPF